MDPVPKRASTNLLRGEQERKLLVLLPLVGGESRASGRRRERVVALRRGGSCRGGRVRRGGVVGSGGHGVQVVEWRRGGKEKVDGGKREKTASGVEKRRALGFLGGPSSESTCCVMLTTQPSIDVVGMR